MQKKQHFISILCFRQGKGTAPLLSESFRLTTPGGRRRLVLPSPRCSPAFSLAPLPRNTNRPQQGRNRPQPNLPPVVSVPASASVESGKQVTIQATASDPNGDTLSYQWSLPAGLTATGQDSATLVVTGPSVTSDTVYDLTLMVTDGALDASAGTRLTVTPLSSGGGCETSDPDAAYWPAWSAGTVYNTNDKVSHKQLVWQAKYWTRGNEPSQSADQWKLVSQVQLGWHAAVAYSAGELANHKGRKWQARYWTKGNEPSTADVWADQGVATCH